MLDLQRAHAWRVQRTIARFSTAMTRKFISQPEDAFRLGDFLLEGFANHGWTEFRGASAFVKRSGTKHIKGAMKAFAARGGMVRFTAGADAGGTSEQGLRDLIDAVGNGPGCPSSNDLEHPR